MPMKNDLVPIIQSRAPHRAVVEAKTGDADNVQGRHGGGAKPRNVSGVLRNLRFDEGHIEHESLPLASAIPARRRDQDSTLSDSLIVVIETDNVVLPEIIAKLDFDDSQRCVGAVTEAMISLRRNVNMLTATQLQLVFSTHHVGNAFDHDPMFAAMRMALQTESRAGLNFQHFYFKAGPLFQHFVAAPWSLVRFAHRTILPGLGSQVIELTRRLIDYRRCRQS